jgi:hypothetical protein
LQRNTSAPGQPGYSCTIAPHAGYLVEQAGRHVLPAAACLEMIRFAMLDATPAVAQDASLRLTNLAWGRPMVAGDRQLNIALLRQSDGRVDFEIYSLGADADDEIVHCQGQATFASGAAGRIALDDLRRRMAREAGADGTYRADGELLAPVEMRAGAAAEALFRAAARFTAGAARRPVHPALPFALDLLGFGPDAARPALAWVRLADGAPARPDVIRLDVDLCDEQGDVIAQAHGLAFDAVRTAADVNPAPVRPAIVLDDPASDSAAAPAPRGPVQITLD